MVSLEKRVKSLELFREQIEERGVYLGKANPSTMQGAMRLHSILRRTGAPIPAKRTNSNPVDLETQFMQKATVLPADPPQQSIPVGPIVRAGATLVWPLLRDWLTRKDEEGSRKGRFGSFLKFIDARNLRQVLFERNKKAEKKYGEGLSMEVGDAGVQTGVDKLSDAVYFLFKTLHEAESLCAHNPNEYNRQLDLITDLHNVLGTFVADLKDVKVRSMK